MLIEHVREQLKYATLAGGVDEQAIHDTEVQLGVRFPNSYRVFLAEFGAALCDGFEIAGLFADSLDDDGPPLWTHIVLSTQQKRRGARGALSHEYVAISDDGSDVTFYLDTGRSDSQGECPVIAVGPGVDGVVVADDFVDFLARSLRRSISY